MRFCPRRSTIFATHYRSIRHRSWIVVPFIVAASLLSSEAQQSNTPPAFPASQDEVVRVSTELVQTAVTVLNKRGQFVDNLNRDDFELRVDGKPQPISFFELVKLSSPRRAASASTNASGSVEEDTAPRNVIFFVDDLHLSSESVARARKMLDTYIDQQMGENDQTAITSASGQIGFLQQFMDSKEALHAAASRLKYRQAPAIDAERSSMSEYQALSIERGDESVLNHFVALILADQFAGFRKGNPAAARAAAQRLVQVRARRILNYSSSVDRAMLATLESLMRISADLPGRKLIVFVSDGFLLNTQEVGVADQLREITDAAIRAGVVIYSLQASGLNTAFPDAADLTTMDWNGDTGRAPLGEDTAMQAPLVELAADTGGRALFNANDLSGAVRRVLDETAQYYLLAWRPEPQLMRERNFHRLEVVLKNRPDCFVRVDHGLFGGAGKTDSASAKDKLPATTAPTQERLAAVIKAINHINRMPTYLAVNYLEETSGPVLQILMNVLLPDGDSSEKGVDVAGVILDENGKLAGTFSQHLSTAAASNKALPAQQRSYMFITKLMIKPGLYQVRGAAASMANDSSARAIRWVNVPELASGRLSMSSLIVGERDDSNELQGSSAVLPGAQLKADNHFPRNSHLRFLTYIYNPAVGSAAEPQVDVQIDLLRHKQLQAPSLVRRLEATGAEDGRKLPFAQELSLTHLATGRYVLRVTATDRIAKHSASQETVFYVD